MVICGRNPMGKEEFLMEKATVEWNGVKIELSEGDKVAVFVDKGNGLNLMNKSTFESVRFRKHDSETYVVENSKGESVAYIADIRFLLSQLLEG